MPISDCARTCWIAAAALALLVWIVTSGIGQMHWFEGLFLALIAGGISGPALIWADCSGAGSMEAAIWQPEVPRELPDPGAPPVAAQKKVMQPVAATKKDDLRKIKGIGPKLEAVLQAEGVICFAQIASWDEADTDRFAAILGRMGNRIRSDDWIGQARVLMQAQQGGNA